MGRNVIGAVGISVANSQVTERTQIREAYLRHWATPFRPQYNNLLDHYQQTAQSAGVARGLLSATATNQAYSAFREQAQILAYNDVFSMVGILAFVVAPLCLLFAPSKAGGGPGGGH